MIGALYASSSSSSIITLKPAVDAATMTALTMTAQRMVIVVALVTITVLLPTDPMEVVEVVIADGSTMNANLYRFPRVLWASSSVEVWQRKKKEKASKMGNVEFNGCRWRNRASSPRSVRR